MYRNNNKVFAPFQFKSSCSQELISETPGEPTDVPVMRRKKWPLALLLLLILAILVCTLPWVERIEGTVKGAEVDPDGSVIAEGEFVLEGKFYDYLLLEDRFKPAAIRVPSLELPVLSAHTSPVYKDAAGLMYTTVFFLDQPEHAGPDDLQTGRLVFPGDKSWFALEVAGRIFVGSPEADPDYAGILELCRPYLMLDPQ